MRHQLRVGPEAAELLRAIEEDRVFIRPRGDEKADEQRQRHLDDDERSSVSGSQDSVLRRDSHGLERASHETLAPAREASGGSTSRRRSDAVSPTLSGKQ
jgi:hypothetical protein